VDAEGWIRAHVEAAGPCGIESDEPWATVWRVPLADGAAFFKPCRAVQRFEPRLTATLASRWPDRIPGVLGWDEDRAWLLLSDAGTPLTAFGDQLDAWFGVLPLYAQLQRGEVTHVAEHLAGGVPDRRPARLLALFGELPLVELPLAEKDVARLRAFVPRFAELCASLDSSGIPDSVQHDDLHAANIWASDGQLRILDWGDACVSHPFCTLAETFRLLEHNLALDPGDPVFERLQDAYLAAWDNGASREIVADAIVVGTFARAIGSLAHRGVMPDDRRGEYDEWLASLLRRGLSLAAG
jgi:Phosphotransferase enzyme family